MLRRGFCHSCLCIAGPVLSLSFTPGFLRAQDKVYICPMDRTFAPISPALADAAG